MRILVASWGNPADWRTVTYELSDPDRRIRLEKKSISTLGILREYLKRTGGIRKTLIFVQDSSIPYLAVEDESRVTYEDIENSVKKYYEEVIRTQILPDERGNVDLDIVVVPAVGSFTPESRVSLSGRRVRRVELQGRSLEDYYALVAKKLADHVVQVLRHPDRSSDSGGRSPPSIEFHVDLSHGINYAPALLLSAVEDIAGVLDATLGGVEIVAYNSEPVQAIRVSSRQQVRIHFTNLPVTPIFRIKLFDDLDKLHSPSKYLISDHPDVASEIPPPDEDLFRHQLLSGAVAAGCPLLIVTLMTELLEIEGSIAEKWLNWAESFYKLNQVIKISRNSDGTLNLAVYSRSRLNQAVVKLSELFILEQALSSHGSIRKKSKDLEASGLISLEELEDMVKNLAIFSKRPALKERALVEIDRIAKAAYAGKPIPCGSPIVLAKLMQRKRAGSPSQDPTKRRRNILAHSCLERNVIEVCHEKEAADVGDIKHVKLRIIRDDGKVYEVYRAVLTELGYKVP
ncbi:MAG: CRISPR-associated CARF protein Csx1 [Candidatus Korarchaeota archaeon]|nr:CRISPR-associated CARF protein Csx1 [Candidatus Korarchaeota archaeon]